MKTPTPCFSSLTWACLIVGATFLVGCDSSTSPNAYQPHFQNQNLQGQINGTPWMLATGNVSSSSWDSSYFFTLVDTVVGNDTCTLFSTGDYREIMFNIGQHKQVLDTGTYVLHFDLGNANAANDQTATFVYAVNGGTPQNLVATEGAVHITEVDTLRNMWVKGMFDVKFDGKNFANGNFTVKYCP